MICLEVIVFVAVWLNLYRIVLEICAVPIGALVILAAFPGLRDRPLDA
jgi:hypothetical protein